MMSWFASQSAVFQAFLAGLFTWSVTALGAATVVFAKKINQKLLDTMLGFAAGVMLAASYWSLLAPSIEMADGLGMVPWIPAATGFVLGGAFLSGEQTSLFPIFTLESRMPKRKALPPLGTGLHCSSRP